jgi:hypothetical protein
VGVDEGRVNRVFLGGPMMGQAASSLDIPITKVLRVARRGLADGRPDGPLHPVTV